MGHFFTYMSVGVICALSIISPVNAAWSLSTKSVVGTVQVISSNTLGILDYTGTEVAVIVDPQTRYEGLSSMSELKGGDKIKVNYSENNNQNIATHIYKISDVFQEDGSQGA